MTTVVVKITNIFICVYKEGFECVYHILKLYNRAIMLLVGTILKVCNERRGGEFCFFVVLYTSIAASLSKYSTPSLNWLTCSWALVSCSPSPNSWLTEAESMMPYLSSFSIGVKTLSGKIQCLCVNKNCLNIHSSWMIIMIGFSSTFFLRLRFAPNLDWQTPKYCHLVSNALW